MSRLSSRFAVVPWLCTSFLLTGCPLSDHYSLIPDGRGGADAGADGGASATGGSESAGTGGSGGDVSGAGAAAGNANGGAAAGNSGNSGAGALGAAGSPEAGSPDMGGNAGQGTGGGSAGLSGSGGFGDSGGDSGSSGSGGTLGGSGGMSGSSGSGGASCSALSCGYTCCGSTCADTTRAFDNCGVCGVSCNAPRSCMSSACTTGWVAMSPPPAALGFAARWRAASVAMGKSVFIWGGSDSSGAVLDSGAIYSTRTDTWTAVAKDAYTPTARVFATAVWTGSVVVVFGGSDASGATPYKDGAVYDPAQDSWSAIPMAGKARSQALGFWDGTRAVYWGGIAAGGIAVSGADRFDLTTWSGSSAIGDPGAELNPASGWDGAALYLHGGFIANARTDKTSSYTSATDAWANLSKSTLARSNEFGVWDGARFVVWGGIDNTALRNDGRYQSGANWMLMSNSGVPSARMAVPRRHGWIFQTSPGLIALFGGETSLTGQGTFTNTGATYNVVSAKWGTPPAWPSGETHDYGVGVWTGDEFVLWGGRTGFGATPGSTLTGERWKP